VNDARAPSKVFQRPASFLSDILSLRAMNSLKIGISGLRVVADADALDAIRAE
jgi:hypothetical protein